MYGPSQEPYGDRPVTENDFCDPATHTFTYAVMKLLNEHMGRRYAERLGASIVCTRPPVVYGHGRKRSAVMWAEHFASKPARRSACDASIWPAYPRHLDLQR